MMALDKELRPDHRHTIHRDRGASSEGSMSPENRSVIGHVAYCLKEQLTGVKGVTNIY